MLAGTKQTWDIFPIITESENEGGTKQESDLEVEPVKLKSNSISKFTVFSEILSSMHSLGNNWKFPNLLSYFFSTMGCDTEWFIYSDEFQLSAIHLIYRLNAEDTWRPLIENNISKAVGTS